MTGIEVVQEIDNFQETLGGMRQIALGHDQAHKQVQIMTEPGVLYTKNMIILPRTP